jgi:muconate/chloromuconate cycloisomerase
MTGSRIVDVRSAIVDVPSIRPHRFASLEIKQQSYLVVEIETSDGLTGVGEGVSPGGPWWSGEAIETQHAMINNHLAQVLLDLPGVPAPHVARRFDVVAYGNHFAKAALEMALFDLTGKRLGVPVHSLLGGGSSRDRIPVRWALGASSPDLLITEARERFAQGHQALKLKAGAVPPADDLARITSVVEAVGPGVDCLVDPNGSWDLPTAKWLLAELEELGVSLLEQPVRREDLDGLRQLTERATRISIMADESVCTPADALRAVGQRCCDAVAIKPTKAGGMLHGYTVGQIAATAGLRCYGGTALESSIGTAASAHLFAALPELSLDCELVGPLLLADDLVKDPVRYEHGSVIVPSGPGLGVELDWDKVREYERC